MPRVGPTDSDDRTEPAQSIVVALAETPNGGEDLAAFHSPGHGWVPLVITGQGDFAHIARVARKLATETGRPIRLVRFSVREVVEEFHP